MSSLNNEDMDRFLRTDARQILLASGAFKLAPDGLDPNYFNTVRIGGGSVEWPDEQDVCPDCLYENSTPLIQGINPPASAI